MNIPNCTRAEGHFMNFQSIVNKVIAQTLEIISLHCKVKAHYGNPPLPHPREELFRSIGVILFWYCNPKNKFIKYKAEYSVLPCTSFSRWATEKHFRTASRRLTPKTMVASTLFSETQTQKKYLHIALGLGGKHSHFKTLSL